jgi:TetR/AcrR family transcriptional regulator
MGIKERKEREKGARREEIVNAAEKIFFEKGLAQATMDEIAEAAELSKGTLYLYYKSKEDLYLSVAMKGTEILYQMFLRIIESGEPTIRMIANLGEAYYEYFKSYRNYFRMYYFFENPQVQSQVSGEMMEVCLESDRKLWDLVESVLQRGIDEGLLRKDLDPLEAGVMLWSNSNGMMRIMDRQEPYWKERMGLNLEKMMRESNRMLVEGMLSEAAKKQYPSVGLMDVRADGGREGRA